MPAVAVAEVVEAMVAAVVRSDEEEDLAQSRRPTGLTCLNPLVRCRLGRDLESSLVRKDSKAEENGLMRRWSRDRRVHAPIFSMAGPCLIWNVGRTAKKGCFCWRDGHSV